MTDKGFDLAGLVRTLVAMRRAGILVHAYLIYGFPGQSRQDIVDSAEVCRQLFAAGLVDSAFWHRFVLTRHSRMYGEWLNGNRPGLEPVDRTWNFANNDLGFAGGEAFDEFDGPLAATLEAWMSGEGLERLAAGRAARQLEEAGLRRGRRDASDASRPSADLVERLVARAEDELDSSRPRREGQAHWVAGIPVLRAVDGRRSRLTWTYRGETRELTLPRVAAPSVASTISALARQSEGRPYADLAATLAAILAPELGLIPESLSELRASGLVVV
jgi:hypothetical protein